MVPQVTVKLIPGESYQQPGEQLGGGQEVLANFTYWICTTSQTFKNETVCATK